VSEFESEIQKNARNCGGSPSMSAAAAFLSFNSSAALETEPRSGNGWDILWSHVHAPWAKKRPVSRFKSASLDIHF
jgi:hypothetical protein